ncbi:unnamed protein product [Effrenium voratum]|uniref:ATP-grasp domain-containing protein n=1 Tax=Effrenium voratum TaxID=2562239 RepID=A0AA36NDQ0_9DINO|nr:unnamed protein product [Effrenium voratum]
MTGKRRPSKGMSCPLPRTFALLGLCVFWGCAWLVMQWKTLQFSPARPPSPDAEDVPGPVPEKAVKPPKSIKTNPSRGHPSRGHQVHPGAHKSQVASCPQRPRRKEKWGEVVKEDMKIIKSSATAVQSCHRLGDALVYELRFLEAHKKEGFAYELLLPDYVVADEAGAGLERRSTLQLLAATGKGLQPLGPAHSSQEQVAKGDGSFGHWREPMERGFEHTASRLRFSTPGNVPLKELTRLVAVVFPMVPAMGFVEVVHKPDKKAKDYDPTKRRRRKELHRELFFEAFPRVGAQPHLADRPEETKPGVSYLWRTSHHDEFHLELKPNEVYEKRMPYAFAEYFGSFEHSGAVLFPPPPTYQYYENKVALTHLFQKSNVLMPETWVFSSLADAMAHRDQVRLPVVLKDPYGYSSIGLLQAETIGELMEAFNTFFAKAKVGVEVLVQRKVKALKEARVTYVDGRPFHGYWRIRQSLKSASAASTRGGFQDFNFPLEPLSDFVASFAQRTGIPVGGVDLIWKDSPDVQAELQLFTVDSSGHFHPLGPAHSAHSFIAEHGDGAYSHWRPGITNSTYGKAMLLFSTPRNVAIKKLSLAAVVYPMLPPMGWIEFNQGKKVNHEELFREMFLQSFAAAGVSRPHLIEQADEAIPGTRYLWRVGGNSEFQLPLADGELYEKRLPYQIAEWYAEFERKGGILYPPPHTYIYYQNKVGLARLFNERKVKIPPTWVFESLSEAEAELENIKFPVVIKDPYGFSSMHLLQAADKEEFLQNCQLYFEKALPGVEAIVQSKVVAMREARVTYIEGRPFHGYWRIRQSLKSASAASNLGGYQDFDFPLSEIAPYVAEFANLTGIPVGGVDFIWEEEKANVTVVPYTLEVSPTSDINPPAPTSWTKTYSEFKHTKGYRRAYLDVRRSWTDLMTLAVIDKYRQERKNLFVDIDNVVAKSMERVRRWKGSKKAYLASEVMQDEVVEGAVEALRRLQARYFIRFLTARGSYEDPFNVTQTWLDSKGFEYDELIVVHGPESKVAHLTSETILVDDFTTSHEKEEPATNQKFMDQLSAAGLPFVKFPLGGRWDDIMEKLLPSG